MIVCIIAKFLSELIQEGEVLKHCVDSMNNDKKILRKELLIFFILAKKHPKAPLVTLEYFLQTHKILQCYGKHNRKPNYEILHYVNKIWLLYSNKTLKQIAA